MPTGFSVVTLRVAAKISWLESANDLVTSPDFDVLVEEVGHPYRPADVLLRDSELSISKSDRGFTSRFASLLCGEESFQ